MIKIVFFLAAVFVLLWLIRSGTSRRQPPPAAEERPGPKPQAMLACAQCGVHLPGNEALPGRGGVFCSEAHRGAYEREHGTG